MMKVRWSKEEALSHLMRWCAQQDRCHSEIRTKLIEHHVYGEDLENVIAFLITEGFLNEERFAINYARGKNRMNHWGRIKIQQHLKVKQVSPYCIKKAIILLDDTEYMEILKQVALKKLATLKYKTTYEAKHKLSSFLHGRGYTFEEISIVQDEIFND